MGLALRVSIITCLIYIVSISAFIRFSSIEVLSVPIFLTIASLGIIGAALSVYFLVRRERRSFLALKQGLEFFCDGDFSVGLHNDGKGEMGGLLDLYNFTAESLRNERQHILQREILFESVILNASICLVMTDTENKVFYTNTEAEVMFNKGSDFINGDFLDCADLLSPNLSDLIKKGGDGIFSVNKEGVNFVYYFSRGELSFNGQAHYLYMIKEMTDQLAVKEVDIWKKAIKVISHELNNSLAPITSMAKSGVSMLDQSRYDSLSKVLDTIYDRAEHLAKFVAGYAGYAKLPLPKKEDVKWLGIIDGLKSTYPFTYIGEDPAVDGYFDPVQMEQVFLNVLKNAHDSGSEVKEITLSITNEASRSKIVISDRGSGMSVEALESSFLPFYSTKVSGTGVGLALSQEIVKAHSGLLTISNRRSGGVSVTIDLPGRIPC